MNTQDFRALIPQAQEDLRRKAVKAVLAGRTRIEVAEVFGVTREAVGGWIQKHRAGGASALCAKPRGRPRGGSLTARQSQQVVQWITDRYPDQLKLPFYLWTREAVAMLIEQKFGVCISIWTVGRYLAAWGFTPQKPVRRAFEQNRELVERWLEKEYPGIHRRAKAERAVIFWGDEMGLRSDHATGRTFSRRGQTPVIPGTGQRFGCNMISAITNRGRLHFMVFRERFRVDVFLQFMKRLVKNHHRRIFLIIDGHPVHKARKVARWIKENRKRISVFFLPGYSPELNPDEMLNQDVKSNAVGRRRASTREELVSTVRGYLKSRQRQPHVVQKYFEEEHVRYAAM